MPIVYHCTNIKVFNLQVILLGLAQFLLCEIIEATIIITHS